MSKLKVAIVDDHTLFSDALKNVLPINGKIESIHTFINGELFLTHLETNEVDVVLLDLGIKEGLNGFETLRELKVRRPNVKCLILTMHTQKEYIEKIQELGANGYMSKESSASELNKAIDYIIRNPHFYCTIDIKETNPFNLLSPAETRVSTEILKGKTNREIAEIFFRTKDNIDTHRKNIYRKLEVNNVVEFVKLGVKHGMITDSVQ